MASEMNEKMNKMIS